MAKRKKPRRGPAPRKKPDGLETAARAIEQIAAREGTTPEMVRKHIQLAMLNGLISDDPKIKAMWARVPKAGAAPTPAELIVFLSKEAAGR